MPHTIEKPIEQINEYALPCHDRFEIQTGDILLFFDLTVSDEVVVGEVDRGDL